MSDRLVVEAQAGPPDPLRFERVGGRTVVVVPAELVVASPCRSCQQPIVWAKIAKAGSDEEKPHPLHLGTKREVGESVELESHFAYCRQAGSWRKTR